VHIKFFAELKENLIKTVVSWLKLSRTILYSVLHVFLHCYTELPSTIQVKWLNVNVWDVVSELYSRTSNILCAS